MRLSAHKNLNDATGQYQQYLVESEELVRNIKDVTKTVQNDINEHFNATVAALEENKKRLLQEVEDIRNARVGKVEKDRNKAKLTIKRFKECRENLKKLNKMKASENEYEAKANAIYGKTDAMVSNRPPAVAQDLAWMEYVIEATPESIVTDPLKADQTIGKELENEFGESWFVMETSRGSIPGGQLKIDRKIKLKLESEFGRGWLFNLAKARGVAVIKTGLIAVAESNANRVSVWQHIGGEYQRKFCLKTPWGIQGLNKPTDVAVMSEDKFAVVDSSDTIKIFSASGEYDPYEWIKEEGTTCVTADSMLDDGRLVLMDSKTNIARFKESGTFLPPIVVE